MHVERRPTLDALRGHVQREVDREVIDGERPIPLEMTRARGERERAAGGGREPALGPDGGAAAPLVQAMLDGHGKGSFTRRSA